MSAKYQRYLASREWALKREAVRSRSGGMCERCGWRKQQSVHHLTYEHIYNEPLEDLQAICNECHAYESGKLQYDPAWHFYEFEFPGFWITHGLKPVQDHIHAVDQLRRRFGCISFYFWPVLLSADEVRDVLLGVTAQDACYGISKHRFKAFEQFRIKDSA